LPLALTDSPDKIGVIGFGSGMTTHSLLTDARVGQVDTIEIEPAMIEGARAFGEKTNLAYDDPRSRIIIDDAKAYFASHSTKLEDRFDIIVSEPSNPWISGVGALFSKEFYQFVPRHIKEDGLFVQWLQLYEISDELVGSILQALTPEFSDYAAWMTNENDLVIVATPHGKLPDLDFSRLAKAPLLLKEMQRNGISSQAHLAFRKVADAHMLRGLAQGWSRYSANSDYSLLLGLHAPRMRFKKESPSAIMSLPIESYSMLLEAAGIRNPLPLEVQSTSDGHFVADFITHVARTNKDNIENNEPEKILNRDYIMLSRLSDVSCIFQKEKRASVIWGGALFGWFENYVANLPPEALNGILVKPIWQRCVELEPQYKFVLDLLESHALRDWDKMEALGREWLSEYINDNTVALRYFDQVALFGILLTQVKQGRWGEIGENQKWNVRELNQKYKNSITVINGLARSHMNGEK